jgi:hypothetical protein
MMRLHKLLEPWGFSVLSETNTEVLQEHGLGSRVDTTKTVIAQVPPRSPDVTASV